MKQRHAPAIGEPAPTFILPSIQGTIFKLADHYQKHHVLIAFMREIDSVSSRRFLAGLQRYHDAYLTVDIHVVVIISVALRERVHWSVDCPFSFPLLMDEDHRIGRRYGVGEYRGSIKWRHSPTIFLLNKEGKIEWLGRTPSARGGLSTSELYRAIIQQLRSRKDTEFLVNFRKRRKN